MKIMMIGTGTDQLSQLILQSQGPIPGSSVQVMVSTPRFVVWCVLKLLSGWKWGLASLEGGIGSA